MIYKTYLLENGVKEENIIEIKLDKMEFITFRNPFMLYKEITKTINKTPLDKYYLFIDEVQNGNRKKDRKSGVTATIYDILNQFKDNKNIDVYVTGSNSKMLSKDISTEFRGRSSQIHVFPLIFF
ncbi:MAG: ATP-binding protein [Christensenellales bacterium]